MDVIGQSENGVTAVWTGGQKVNWEASKQSSQADVEGGAPGETGLYLVELPGLICRKEECSKKWKSLDDQ